MKEEIIKLITTLNPVNVNLALQLAESQKIKVPNFAILNKTPFYFYHKTYSCDHECGSKPTYRIDIKTTEKKLNTLSAPYNVYLFENSKLFGFEILICRITESWVGSNWLDTSIAQKEVKIEIEINDIL